MSNRRKKQFFTMFFLGCIIGSGMTVPASLHPQGSESTKPIFSDSIIRQGLTETGRLLPRIYPQGLRLAILETWLNANPFVEYASRIKTSITVKFIDGSYTVLIDPFPVKTKSIFAPLSDLNHEYYGSANTSSAILLNPDEYTYGHRQCQQIITTLLRHDYHINYLANDAVSLSYLRLNLSADIIYMDTHAGFFDTNGDHQADAVVIATGEPWTNDTELTYSFEYQHHMIVKGMIGTKSIIAFTPAFIKYYYPQGTLSGSLVYMATCFATYDASMADAFLNAGAYTYIGWSGNTAFWTNSRTSVQAFRLFANGCTVRQVCSLVRYGGFLNRLFHSKLLYYGDGQHRIPR
jgi:hypothetical protein